MIAAFILGTTVVVSLFFVLYAYKSQANGKQMESEISELQAQVDNCK